MVSFVRLYRDNIVGQLFRRIRGLLGISCLAEGSSGEQPAGRNEPNAIHCNHVCLRFPAQNRRVWRRLFRPRPLQLIENFPEIPRA